ncbi:HNH endonuclease signature motif containing protein [Arthrobacter sp. RHLT1-20]
METVGEFIPFQDTDQGPARAGVQGAARDEQPGVDSALALLRGVIASAARDAALWGYRAASDFAGRVEELSRTVEYLQLVAAAAVDRTRKQSAAAASKGIISWTTGWRDTPGAGAGGQDGAAAVAAAATAVDVDADADAIAADDGYRNTTEFLRARLRISASEARRRLSLAESLLPRQGIAGRQLPPAHQELGAAVASGEVASRAGTIIAIALDHVRHICDAGAAARMEHALTLTAAENDPDFLVRVARSWTDAMDQDGAEPSEELLRQIQGAFIRKTRHGLHHVEIFATAEQFEHLLTVMNTATNPRTGGTQTAGRAAGSGSAAGAGSTAGAGSAAAGDGPASVSASVSGAAGLSTATDAWVSAGVSAAAGTPEDDPGAARLDLRSRAQKLLDGLVGACKVALASGSLPAAGGLRPQVMVTIDYRDLLARLATAELETPSRTASYGPTSPGRPTAHTGTLLFTGPVTASTARRIACDADIIPVLLGGDGRILDIGRASRIFPPHIRKAITARDQGCAFPGCTIPAPWCEAHHISYWSRGGTTSTDNGTMLCSHHHHIIHREQWTIQIRTGIPWFIPPPHLDPRQRPRRNHYFRPADLDTSE